MPAPSDAVGLATYPKLSGTQYKSAYYRREKKILSVVYLSCIRNKFNTNIFLSSSLKKHIGKFRHDASATSSAYLAEGRKLQVKPSPTKNVF